MVDTTRTQAELLEIFKDGQAAGSITPQDVRDLIVSMMSSSAAGRFTSPAVITPTAIATMTSPSSGTSALINSSPDIIMPQDGRIQYIGTVNRNFLLSVTLTAYVGSNNQDIRFQLTQNGLPMAETIVGRSWGTGADEGFITIITGVVLSQNDYIELQAANDTSTASITVVNGVITMHGSII